MRLLLVAIALLTLVPSPARADEAVKLAVMYFENQGNDDLSMLRVGLAQMLITDLSAEQRFDVVERTRINEILAEQDLQATDKIDPDTAVELGRIIGARYMVLGSYFELMGQLRVDARVVDVATSRIVSVGSRQPATALWDLHDELVGAIADAVAEAEKRRGAWDEAHPPKPRLRLRGTQGAAPMSDDSEVSKKSSSAPAASPAPTPEPTPAPPADPMGAAIAFSEGLDFLDRKDLKRARKKFERAVELDPTLEDAKTELASLSI